MFSFNEHFLNTYGVQSIAEHRAGAGELTLRGKEGALLVGEGY